MCVCVCVCVWIFGVGDEVVFERLARGGGGVRGKGR